MNDVCPYCRLAYSDFRTGMTYREVYTELWVDDDDSSNWKYKRRHTVLGRWRMIKQTMWEEHLLYCKQGHDEEEVI